MGKSIWARRPRIHGPRGWALLGIGIMSIGFGLFYVGPYAHPEPDALKTIEAVLPFSVWGIIWIVNGCFLLAASMRTDQARALGATTGLFTIWTINYAIAFIEQIVTTGASYYWLTAVLFAGFVITLLGMAKMVNPGATHLTVVQTPGPPIPEGGSDA